MFFNLPFLFFFSLQKRFNVPDFNYHHFNMNDPDTAKDLNSKLGSAVYLQVSTISQALIFVTRSRDWSFTERPGLLLMSAFVIAQLVIGSRIHVFVPF